jgi:hypothetical protein
VGNIELALAEESMHVSLAVQDHASVFPQSQGNGESTVLFGSADKVTGICSEEKT